MSIGIKTTLAGTVELAPLNQGSKSEHKAFVLRPDIGGPLLPIRVKGVNPFYDKNLEEFLGKRVTIEGVIGSGKPGLFVEKLSDITIIDPPANKVKPKGPSL